MKLDWRTLIGRPRPVGVVDTRSARIQGWAYDKSSSRPLVVEIFVDGTHVGTATADRYREDLVPECPGGRCAFDFTVPAHLRDGAEHAIEVREHGTHRSLLSSRFKARLIAADYFNNLVRQALRQGAWAAFARREGETVVAYGWAIAPPGVKNASITANGRPVDVVFKDDSDARWQTPLPPGLKLRTFTATAPIDSGRDEVVLSFGAGQPFHPLQDLRFPLFDLPLPDAKYRKRVDGHGDPAGFNLGGYSNAYRLDTIAQRFAGKSLAKIGPVLDWGCGCGRVARFVARAGADLTGVDIDAENAAWCAANIPGRFLGVKTEPPMPFADNTFAAIYGLSVFTHLSREHEAAFLKELHRIAKPGALLMLSIHGGLAAAYSGMMEHVYSGEFADGFVDIGRNPDIDAVTGGSGYYRNIFHVGDYISKVWGQHFEILSIEEGIIDNRQDLVVARKR